jgi:hypothetical protein
MSNNDLNLFVWGILAGFLVCTVFGLVTCSPAYVADDYHERVCRAEMKLLPTGADSVVYLIKDSWCAERFGVDR